MNLPVHGQCALKVIDSAIEDDRLWISPLHAACNWLAGPRDFGKCPEVKQHVNLGWQHLVSSFNLKGLEILLLKGLEVQFYSGNLVCSSHKLVALITLEEFDHQALDGIPPGRYFECEKANGTSLQSSTNEVQLKLTKRNQSSTNEVQLKVSPSHDLEALFTVQFASEASKSIFPNRWKCDLFTLSPQICDVLEPQSVEPVEPSNSRSVGILGQVQRCFSGQTLPEMLPNNTAGILNMAHMEGVWGRILPKPWCLDCVRF